MKDELKVIESPFLHILFLADLLQESSGCVRVNGNLNLSRAIGDLEYKKRSDLPPQEQVICSTPDVVVRVARRGSNFGARAAQELTSEDEFIVLACTGA